MIVFCPNDFDDNVRSQFPAALVGDDSGNISTTGGGGYGTTREYSTVAMHRGVK
jgi:N-methylhydantoinase B/oxoprolinase/acetone carboxylase alpha subunit